MKPKKPIKAPIKAPGNDKKKRAVVPYTFSNRAGDIPVKQSVRCDEYSFI